MTDDEKLGELAALVGTTTAYDRVIQAGLDVVQLAPIAGHIAVSIFKQLIPTDQSTFARDYAIAVARRIADMEASKVDRSYFDSPEWGHDARRVGDSLRLERNRTKRDAYVAALANSAPTDRPLEHERHRFLDLLDSIRPSHLRLLAVIVTAMSDMRDGSFDDWIRRRLKDHDVENVRLDWLDLQQAGLLAAIPTGMATTSLESRIESALPAIGRRFVAFVEAVPETEEPSQP